jgi:hypothetical protein
MDGDVDEENVSTIGSDVEVVAVAVVEFMSVVLGVVDDDGEAVGIV